MTDETATQDPAAIERDIHQTQDEMSRTVDRIGEQFSFRNVVNALLDRTETGEIDVRGVYNVAKRNPIALAMIAGGGIWLASGSDANGSTIRSAMPKRTPKTKDRGHGEYISHMSQIERAADEDEASYQRRRDIARSNYFMVERGHEEEESSFRARLDHATEEFAAKRKAWGRRAQQAGKSVGQTGMSVGKSVDETRQAAMERAATAYDSNPLIGGVVAAAAGAALGALLPSLRIETERLGPLGSKAREIAGEQTDKLTDAVIDKKDDLVAQIEETVAPAQQEPALA